jgi:hypothetical protein
MQYVSLEHAALHAFREKRVVNYCGHARLISTLTAAPTFVQMRHRTHVQW